MNQRFLRVFAEPQICKPKLVYQARINYLYLYLVPVPVPSFVLPRVPSVQAYLALKRYPRKHEGNLYLLVPGTCTSYLYLYLYLVPVPRTYLVHVLVPIPRTRTCTLYLVPVQVVTRTSYLYLYLYLVPFIPVPRTYTDIFEYSISNLEGTCTCTS